MRAPSKSQLYIPAAAWLAQITMGGFMAITATFSSADTPIDYPKYPYRVTNYDEPLRGQYHFSTQSGWMNDVNGPIYYRGTYHIFYQHNPYTLEWDEMHWGHATSPDLVHWTQQPIALDPRVHPGNLWSGAGWVDTDNVSGLKEGDEAPILLYTNTEGVSIAYSTDGARTFQMYNKGEKVFTIPYESRDPKVQWDPAAKRWVMAFWGLKDEENLVHFYSSENLLEWTPRGEFRAAWFYECPDLFQLPVEGDPESQKWVLMSASGEYVLGELDEDSVFVADPEWTTPQAMEHGEPGFRGNWYGPLTFNQLPENRVVQMAWQPGNLGAIWTGNLTFPVELSLREFPNEGLRITRNPVSEIKTIRSSTQQWEQQRLLSTAGNLLADIRADAYEIEAEFDITEATATTFGFELGYAPNQTPSSRREVIYDRGAQTLDGKSMPPINNRVKIRLLVDRGQLAIFGNHGKLVISDNVNFSPNASEQGVNLLVNGGEVTLVALRFHTIKKIWDPALAGPKGSPIKYGGNTSKCVHGDGVTGLTELRDCVGNDSQSWMFHGDGTIYNINGCIELPSGKTANGTLVRVGRCTATSNQIWSENANGGWKNEASGRCLDLRFGKQDNGSQLQVWDCVNSPHQEWVKSPQQQSQAQLH